MRHILLKSITSKALLAIFLLGTLGGLSGCDPYKRSGDYGRGGGNSGGGHGH